MKFWLVALSCLLLMASIFVSAQSEDAGYQMASVVSIDKVPANAQHPENAGHYKISMRLGDTVYLCHGEGGPAVFIDWSPGKEFPAKLDGKALLVKGPNGQVVNLNVTGKKAVK